ncbi:MAG: hypothetical protein GEV10_09660 [Streptosporangiales bacterium]|nr:hypothetical protein [Streptosporangiales bacterium]
MRRFRGSTGGRTRRAGVVLVALALAVVGCTEDPNPRDQSSSPPGKAMKFALGATDYNTTLDVPTEPAEVVKTNTPGIEFELYALQRSDNVVSIIFALHNTGDSKLDLNGPSEDLAENTGAAASRYADNVGLIDTEGLKEYKVFEADDQCLCTATYATIDREDIGPDERHYHVVQVAAPPADVTKVTVMAGTMASVHDATITG